MSTELMACREALAALQVKYAYEVDRANALRAENERLRAALTKWADAQVDYAKWAHMSVDQFIECIGESPIEVCCRYAKATQVLRDLAAAVAKEDG